jgi:hypothetical protein
MSALLTMLPPEEDARLVLDPGWQQSKPGECLVAYEISPGRYEGYVWGDEVREMTELGLRGCRLVTNLHADTLSEARSQIVDQCGASHEGFASFGIFIPITLREARGRTVRTVDRIFSWSGSSWDEIGREFSLSAREAVIGSFVDECVNNGVRTCGDVRRSWHEWRRHNGR